MDFPSSTVLYKTLFLFSGAVILLSAVSARPLTEDFCKGKHGPVAFPHELHMDLYDCLAYHHDYDSSGHNVIDPGDLYPGSPSVRCASCHDINHKINLEEAFHRQCIGCHVDTDEIGRPGGPIFCGECHGSHKHAPESDIILGN